MATGDIPKLDRIVQLPKLNDFKDLLKWAKDFAAQAELKLSQISAKSNDQQWQLIHEYQFEAAADSYTMSVLDGNTQREYLILCTIKNAYNGTANFYIRPNADTGANYGFVYFLSDGTSDGRGASATATGLNVGYCSAINLLSYCKGTLLAKSGFARCWLAQGANSVNGATIGAAVYESGVWNNTADNIASLVLASNRANAIGIGSRIELWSR